MNKRQKKKEHKKEIILNYYSYVLELASFVPLCFLVPRYSDRKAIIKIYKKVNL